MTKLGHDNSFGTSVFAQGAGLWYNTIHSHPWEFLKQKSSGDGSFSGGNRFTLFEASKILVRLTGAFCVAKTHELPRKTSFSARFEAVQDLRVLEGLRKCQPIVNHPPLGYENQEKL